MKKLIIRYDKRKCVGNGGCAAVAPAFFKLEGDRVVCVGAKADKTSDFFVRHVPCDEETAGRIIAAGKSCPVNAIGIYDSDSKQEIVGTRNDGVASFLVPT